MLEVAVGDDDWQLSVNDLVWWAHASYDQLLEFRVWLLFFFFFLVSACCEAAWRSLSLVEFPVLCSLLQTSYSTSDQFYDIILFVLFVSPKNIQWPNVKKKNKIKIIKYDDDDDDEDDEDDDGSWSVAAGFQKKVNGSM